MKSFVLFILSVITLFGCSTQNPNPNTNNSNNYSYTQGANLIDADGNVYPTFITSCGQTWMQKNLDVSHYRNGDVIPQVTDPTTWTNLTSGAWCYYNNDPALGAVYGKLYNWYAVNDPRGLAPSGWHVPSDAEWNILVKCIDPSTDTTGTGPYSDIAGGAMKEAGNSHWNSPNLGANNSSGFTGLPGGSRLPYSVDSFRDLGNDGFWWSSTVYYSTQSWLRYLSNTRDVIYRNYEQMRDGFSIRLIRD